MNEGELGAKLGRYLDATAEDLDPRILRRLEQARGAALERFREVESMPAFQWAGARGGGGGTTGGARVLLPAAAFLVALVGAYLWQASHPPAETEELELLSDELPLDAYLDKGFQQWISGSLRR